MEIVKKETRYCVLSLRISENEKAIIDQLKSKTGKNISMLMRELLQQYLSTAGAAPYRLK